MTTFVFVRHGEPTGEPGDAGLSAAGRSRIEAFVADIAAAYPEDTVVVVAHGGVVDDLLGGHEHWPYCGVTEHEP